jgi:hypothetical protein
MENENYGDLDESSHKVPSHGAREGTFQTLSNDEQIMFSTDERTIFNTVDDK